MKEWPVYIHWSVGYDSLLGICGNHIVGPQGTQGILDMQWLNELSDIDSVVIILVILKAFGFQ